MFSKQNSDQMRQNLSVTCDCAMSWKAIIGGAKCEHWGWLGVPHHSSSNFPSNPIAKFHPQSLEQGPASRHLG